MALPPSLAARTATAATGVPARSLGCRHDMDRQVAAGGRDRREPAGHWDLLTRIIDRSRPDRLGHEAEMVDAIHGANRAYSLRSSLSVRKDHGFASFFLTDTAVQFCTAGFVRPGYLAAGHTFQPAFTRSGSSREATSMHPAFLSDQDGRVFQCQRWARGTRSCNVLRSVSPQATAPRITGESADRKTR